jgi:hypothetical protein
MSALCPASPAPPGGLYVPADGRCRGLIFVCHERYGLVQHTLDLAQRFANDGYVAIAPDWFRDLAASLAALRAYPTGRRFPAASRSAYAACCCFARSAGSAFRRARPLPPRVAPRSGLLAQGPGKVVN